MDFRLQQNMAQQLVMTPQLQQAIALLALSHTEMAELLQREMAENPVLEEADCTLAAVAPDAGPEPRGEGQDLGGAGDDSRPGEGLLGPDAPNSMADPPAPAGDSGPLEWQPGGGGAGAGASSAHDDGLPIEARVARPTSLIEHLRWQVHMARLSPQERHVALFLAEEVTDDGYLDPEALTMAADECDVDEAQVQAVLAVLQAFDPPGVGARDLRECLMLQAQHLRGSEPLAWAMLEHHLPLLERRAMPQLARALGASPEAVGRAVRVLATLEPRPGRRFGATETPYIVPDVYVVPDASAQLGFSVSLNDDGLRGLRISPLYADVDAYGHDSAARGYLQERRQHAAWLIRSVQMRQRTILKVMHSILRLQRGFFEHGEGQLVPLILRDVAQDVGMHESTISRVTTNKYAHTPHGIHELKFFFSSTVRGVSGETLASQSVRSHIQRLVAEEPPDAPHSDQRLVEILRERDIDIARRTVAKYREMLKIPPSSRRRRVY